MPLTAAERKRLDAAVAAAEARTGAQIVVACLPKSDSYPELPWKAFASAAALTALAAVLIESFQPGWITGATPLFVALSVLGAGVVAAAAAIFLPAFARLFLRRARAEVEAQQQARALFLERECFATRARCAVLLLISVFERQIVILPDKGVRERVPETVWAGVIDAMRDRLANGQRAQAIDVGLAALEERLRAYGFHGGGARSNELPNRIIEAKEE